MASSKEYNMLFKLSAQLGKEFGTTFNSAQEKLKATQKEIQALNKQQSDISAYQRQQKSVETTTQKLATLQKQYDNIQKEIQETEGYSSSLENKLLDKKDAIDKVSASLQVQTERLSEMRSALEDSGINTSDLTGESEKLSTKLDSLAKTQENSAKEAKNFGAESVNAFEVAGAALVASGIAAGLKAIYNEYKECVSISADFEETMSTVEAISGASAEEIAGLSAMAKELGASTKFTAKESADAMTYMAMAGWDAQQMMSGMNGVLQLASASGEDLATVSDIVTDNLTAFGMAASETARFSDVLAATATNSNTSVSIMGETFKKAAPVAGALGYSIEDVSVAIGLMANAGVKGSRAGTALSNTFSGLLSGATLSAEAIGEVEYSTISADGTMKSFGDTIIELRGYFDQMTEAEKTLNAMSIAGKQGYAGLLAILNSSDTDFQKLTASINNCSGAAQKMAEIKLDNLNGQLTLLNSAADAVKTTIGEAYNKELRKAAEIGTDILSGINEFLSEHPVLLKSLIAITAEVGLIVGAYYGYIAAKKVMNTVTALSTIIKAKETAATVSATAAQTGLNVAMAANPIGAVLTVVALLTTGLIALKTALSDAKAEYDELTAAAQNLDVVIEESNQKYEATTAEIIGTSELTDIYIAKLKSLEEQGLNTRVEQEEYALVVKRLNDLLPELNLEIDAQTGLVKGGTKAVEDYAASWKEAALQQALATRYEDEIEAWAEAESELYVNKAKLNLEEEERNRLLAKRTELEYEAIKLNEARAKAEWENDYATLSLLQDEYSEWDSRKQQLDKAISKSEKEQKNLNKAIADGEKKIEEAKGPIDEARTALELYAESTKSYTDAVEDIYNDNIQESINAVNTLAESYKKTLDEAEKSISGQYKLWDTAAVVVMTDINTINTGLETQFSYWQDYNKDLTILGNRVGDIEGLSEVIASFADGSKESVNAIAGMAAASDEELKKMVNNWKEVQRQQKETAESLAKLAEDCADEMVIIIGDSIDELNFDDEAANAAKATVEAYTQAIKDGTMDAVAAAQALSSLVASALADASITVSAEETQYAARRNMSISAYATGTSYARPGLSLVGEEGPELVMMRGGETVLNAQETRSALGTGDVIITISPSFTVQGGESMEEQLRAFTDEIVEEVKTAIEEAGINTKRSAYS